MKTTRFLAALFFAAGFTVASAQTYTFSTLAGADGLGSADGPADAARFSLPHGIAFDRSGNLFVADFNNHTIRKMAPDGMVTTLAGLAGSTGSTDGTGSAARFFFPQSVAVDGSGNVFVADTYNRTVRKITAGGVVTTLAGMAGSAGSADGIGSDARFFSPEGVAADGNGNVFVADSYNQTIRKITADGVVTTVAGLGGSNGFPGSIGSTDGMGASARFNFPSGVAVDGSGNLFVADTRNHTIRKITAGGVVTTLAGLAGNFGNGSTDGTGSAARFSGPVALAVDDLGSVFVLDHTTLRKITPAGVVTTVVGFDGNGATPFYLSFGVAVDRDGNVNVADTRNHVIRKVAADGVISTVAGLLGRGSADGSGAAAQFNSPVGVAVDGSGNVFVADGGNGTVRKITADGIVTTLAGLAGSFGSVDGTGSAARLSPGALAVDSSGNVFVAENLTVRKITPDGVVTTLAGMAGAQGDHDGAGSAALFGDLTGVAVDGSGNVFVADQLNCNIRKITADGGVTTLAGLGNTEDEYLFQEHWGSNDGTGSNARFGAPQDVAVDGSGNVFVADWGNNTIRKITADGIVTTLAGVAGISGSNDGTGSAARFSSPFGVAVDSGGNVFVAGNGTIRKITADGVVTTLGGVVGGIGISGVAVDRSGNLFVADTANNMILKGVPVVFATVARSGPQSQHVAMGAGATFTVVPASSGLGFQWKKDGVAIAGATGDTYDISRTAGSDMGFYSVVVTGAVVPVESPVAILTVATGGTSRLSNFSARGLVPAGGDLTAGFVIRGSGGKSVLVRAVGPTLGSFGVSGALADPRLDVIPAGTSATLTSNDDWGGGPLLAGAFASVGAFPLPAGSKDAAVLGTLTAGGTTARVTSSLASGSGIALAEVYDRDPVGTASRLVNISTLGFTGPEAPALTLGFVIDGAESKRILIRAIGPGLAPLGVASVLGDPQLAVTPLGKSFTVASNDNWGGDAALASAFVAAGTFALPTSSKDAAVVVRLPPGGYTVTVSGIPYTTGRALVEIYDLDP